jgi:hypothetical protein
MGICASDKKSKKHNRQLTEKNNPFMVRDKEVVEEVKIDNIEYG